MEVYLVRTEVRPLAGSSMHREDPKVKGAFVNCVIATNSLEMAKNMTRDFLLHDGYMLVNITGICEFEQFEWTDESDEIIFKAMAWDALMKGEFGLGPFYCYYDGDE